MVKGGENGGGSLKVLREEFSSRRPDRKVQSVEKGGAQDDRSRTVKVNFQT